MSLAQGKARLVKVCNRNPDVPPPFEQIGAQDMELEPHRRYDTVAQARQALRTAYKNARLTTVRRVSLDEGGPRKLAPLVEKTVPVVAYPPPPRAPEVTPPPAAPLPAASAPPPVEEKPKGGLLGFFKRNAAPALGHTWLSDAEGKPSESASLLTRAALSRSSPARCRT